MAVSLFKLVMNATTTTIARPTIRRYFYKYATAEQSGVNILIPHSKFTNDSGTLLGATNLTTVTVSNGYYLLFVNGQLQETSLYTVGNAGSLVSILSGGATVPVSAPITLVVNNFAPNSTTTVTT